MKTLAVRATENTAIYNKGTRTLNYAIHNAPCCIISLPSVQRNSCTRTVQQQPNRPLKVTAALVACGMRANLLNYLHPVSPFLRGLMGSIVC